jgi:hypothetical protein
MVKQIEEDTTNELERRELMRTNDQFHLKQVVLLSLMLLVAGAASSSFAQGTAFTYQGRLQDGGTNANGSYDLQFKLFDAPTVGTGTQFGGTVSTPNTQVADGIFTVTLDFGGCPNCFNGAGRFLEIAVKPTSGSTFTTLSPRQPIASTPYAIRSLSANTASTASNATQLGGVAASQYVLTSDSRLSDARTPTGGSSFYIQNTTTQQASSNFNISGNGIIGGNVGIGTSPAHKLDVAGAVNVTSQYNLGGQQVLTASGISGQSTTIVGIRDGDGDPSGVSNSFFGSNAGAQTTTGTANSFFGRAAGFNITTGSENAFYGTSTGGAMTTGSENAFFGRFAGDSLNDESRLTLIGAQTESQDGVQNATAIGYRAMVTQSNSLVLGSINGINGSAANTNVGIGTTAPVAKLQVAAGDVYVSTAGQGVILKSPNGTVCRRLSIDNAGAIVLTALACP